MRERYGVSRKGGGSRAERAILSPVKSEYQSLTDILVAASTIDRLVARTPASSDDA
jgi:hypothetical protein